MTSNLTIHRWRAAAAFVVLLAIATITPAAAGDGCSVPMTSAPSPWSMLGLPVTAKPSWVDVCAERRLRLLPALPGIEAQIATQADGYFQGKGPGLTIGLVLGDGLYYSQGFGFRDAAKTRAPDETTIFAAGSLSKVITGTALLTLIDDGTHSMSLNDPADLTLPELDFVCPQFGQAVCKCPSGAVLCKRGPPTPNITLDNLVSHTAGLPDVMEPTNATRERWEFDLEKAWLHFPPASASSYAGIDAEAVGLIEWRKSKAKTYADFIQANLFAPLGMTHSTMDDSTLSPTLQPLLAQRWFWKVNADATWTFAPDAGGRLYPADEVMLLPAGGLVTTVWDVSHFLKMFLDDQAPLVPGTTRPLISATSLQSAVRPQVQASAANAMLPASCAGGATTDTNFPPFPVLSPPAPANKASPGGFTYRACGPVDAFGINWILTGTPIVWHNGEFAMSGSETEMSVANVMAATGLMSTIIKPVAKAQMQPQPPGLDPNILQTIIRGTLLQNGGIVADQQTTWNGAGLPNSPQLAQGVARLLWLSNASAPKGVAPPIFEGSLPTPTTDSGKPHPLPPPALPNGYVNVGSKWWESPARLAYQQMLERLFSPAFAAKTFAYPVSVESFLTSTFAGANKCSTFRVREVRSDTDITLRFLCFAQNGTSETVDMRMVVDAQGRIDGLPEVRVPGGDY